MTVDPSRAARTRTGWIWFAAAFLGVVVAQMLGPSTSPPLYDGVGFPDEPYRWVAPPPDAPHTPPPTSATMTLAMAGDGKSPSGRGFSAEQGPQVALAVAAGAIIAPPGSRVTITAHPLQPPVGPDGVTVVSDLYHLEVTDPAGPVSLGSGGVLLVNLRAERATDLQVVFATWDGGRWTQWPTTQVGTEIYAASLPRFMDFALFRLAEGVTASVSGGSQPPNSGSLPNAAGDRSSSDDTALTSSIWLWGGILIPILVLGGAVLLIRRAHSRITPVESGDEPLEIEQW